MDNTAVKFLQKILFDLFDAEHCRDYRPQPELDVYSESGLDSASEFSELTPAARQAAERVMDERDNIADEFDLFYDQVIIFNIVYSQFEKKIKLFVTSAVFFLRLNELKLEEVKAVFCWNF